jgi:hypothetical protein
MTKLPKKLTRPVQTLQFEHLLLNRPFSCGGKCGQYPDIDEDEDICEICCQKP